MEHLDLKTIKSRVYADPELRRVQREKLEELERQREAHFAAEAERVRTRPQRLEAFWQEIGLPHFSPQGRERKRLLRMPVAEAWIFEHPLEMNSENCPTQREGILFARHELKRLKAARRIFKELGIK
jgi:hypothetical protein